MKRETVQKFKLLLENQLKETVQAKTNLIEVLHAMSEPSTDLLDLAAAHTSNSIRFRLSQRELLLAQKIEAALGRLKNGSFGICGSCEDVIDEKRLEAKPTALLCFICQSRAERKSS